MDKRLRFVLTYQFSKIALFNCFGFQVSKKQKLQ